MKLPENYFIAYLLWFVSVGLTIASIIAGRVFFMALIDLVIDNDWRLSLADRTIVLLLGLAGLCFVLYFEYFYRQSVGRDLLWPRFFKISAVQIAFLIAGGMAPFISGF